ncbi:hypothetical protein BpHYR1_028920, partial [Brachionus plicatilis]
MSGEKTNSAESYLGNPLEGTLNDVEELDKHDLREPEENNICDDDDSARTGLVVSKNLKSSNLDERLKVMLK